MGVKCGTEEGTFSPLIHAKFHPIGATCCPCVAKKPQNWPLSNLNNRRFVLCAMLPAKNTKCKHMTTSLQFSAANEALHFYTFRNSKLIGKFFP